MFLVSAVLLFARRDCLLSKWKLRQNSGHSETVTHKVDIPTIEP